MQQIYMNLRYRELLCYTQVGKMNCHELANWEKFNKQISDTSLVNHNTQDDLERHSKHIIWNSVKHNYFKQDSIYLLPYHEYQ